MFDTAQETYVNANSSNVMIYNSINDALEKTTLTKKKGNIRTEFCIHLKHGK